MYENPREQHSKIRTTVLSSWVSRPTETQPSASKSTEPGSKSTGTDAGNVENPPERMMDMLEIHGNGSRDVGNPPEHPAPFPWISYIFNRSGGFSTSRNVAKSTGTDPFPWISTSVPVDFEAVPVDFPPKLRT